MLDEVKKPIKDPFKKENKPVGPPKQQHKLPLPFNSSQSSFHGKRQMAAAPKPPMERVLNNQR